MRNVGVQVIDGIHMGFESVVVQSDDEMLK